MRTRSARRAILLVALVWFTPCALQSPDPYQATNPLADRLVGESGHGSFRRLNRAEYNNTVRDLLGTTLRPADDFPADDRSNGFDNMGDLLGLSPTLLDLYRSSAEVLIAEALRPRPLALSQHFEAEDVMRGHASSETGESCALGWKLGPISGDVPVPIAVEADGNYKISVRAFEEHAGSDPARLAISDGGKILNVYDVTSVEANPVVYATTARLRPGKHTLFFSLINGFEDVKTHARRRLTLDWMQLDGPMFSTATDQRAPILSCQPDADQRDFCARKIIANFGRRAFRRPLSDDEVDRLVQLATTVAPHDFARGIQRALEAMLVSPNFLFRMESAAAKNGRLTDWEIASRLSYFLWSSMPDDVLLKAAEEGRLRNEDGLKAEALRMLDDPKSDAFVENFSGQWLYTRLLDDAAPDETVFHAWDNELRDSMRKETQLYFREFLRGDIGMDRFLTANFTFMNERLARHYGTDWKQPQADFVRTTLPATRRGLLTQGSVLTVTSPRNRTSPVKRGKWVLEQMLCAAPPPPPPGVPPLIEDGDDSKHTMRERLEEHQRVGVCHGCHRVMDPIGFGLEHFDAIGAYRETDNGAIDATGQILDRDRFDGALELANVIAADSRFAPCVVRQLFTYAMGRAPDAEDQSTLRDFSEQFSSHGYHLKDLVFGIIESAGFRGLGDMPPAAVGALK